MVREVSRTVKSSSFMNKYNESAIEAPDRAIFEKETNNFPSSNPPTFLDKSQNMTDMSTMEVIEKDKATDQTPHLNP